MLPTTEEKRAALHEVLQTATFVRAGQLQSFLRLICEMEIAGRAGEINEYLIGVEVLGRPPGYSPAQDSVVRRRAVDLREKLEEVYTHELAGARWRVELPKGRYVPRFVAVNAVAVPPAESAPASARPGRLRGHLPGLAAGLVGGVLLTSAVFFLLAPIGGERLPSPPRGTVYEAEAKSNVLSGAVAIETCEPCSGRHRVRRIGHLPANFVALRGVRVPSSGTYVVVLHYLLNGERTFFVSVNDGPGLEVPLTGASWTEPARAPVTLPLRAGENTIKVYNDAAYAPDLDRIVVMPAEGR